jgi:hypothetical protein
MSEFKKGDRVEHPMFGVATVVGPSDYGHGYFLVVRDDGCKGAGPNREWITSYEGDWKLRASIQPEIPAEAYLETIFINTSAMLQALDAGYIPEEQGLPALAGMGSAYVEILGARYADKFDARIAERVKEVKAFAE